MEELLRTGCMDATLVRSRTRDDGCPKNLSDGAILLLNYFILRTRLSPDVFNIVNSLAKQWWNYSSFGVDVRAGHITCALL